MDKKILVMTYIGIFMVISACTNHITSPDQRQGFRLPSCKAEKLQWARERHIQIKGQSDRPAFCVTSPGQDKDGEFRKEIEDPFIKATGAHEKPLLGVALSGGGSKAAAFAMGVLGGLADTGLLDRTDYISSVSGGGYAAYFLYAQVLLPLVRPEHNLPRVLSLEELFADCPGEDNEYLSPQLRKKLEKNGMCPSGGVMPSPPVEENQKQAFVRVTQDVLNPGKCNTRGTNEDWGTSLQSFIGNCGMTPVSLILNTLWDTGIGVSVTAKTYRDGIGITYGAIPAKGFQFQNCSEKGTEIQCSETDSGKPNVVLECKKNWFDPDPEPLTFEELKQGLLTAGQSGSHLPYWIINATGTKYRSVFGWLKWNEQDLSDVFEMTALSHGSRRYGYVSTDPSIHQMNVLDAVEASAAFFDPNEQAKSQPKRGLVGFLQHFFNLDWGIDIRNYNVDDWRASLHRTVPIPLYWMDKYLDGDSFSDKPGIKDRHRSAFIRLVDGGNSENLGLFSLIKRNVRNIVVSDAAYDKNGEFEDICQIRKMLSDEGKSLYLPGLNNLDEYCDSKNEKGLKQYFKERNGFNLHKWTLRFPVLLGCVRNEKQKGKQPCMNLGEGESRLFVVKPAVDYISFRRNDVSNGKGNGANEYTIERCWIPDDGIPDFSKDEKKAAIPCHTAVFMCKNESAEEGACQAFPQHRTTSMTADSSYTLYSAYRDLGRQYTTFTSRLLKLLLNNESEGQNLYERMLEEQLSEALQAIKLYQPLPFCFEGEHRLGCTVK